MRTLTCDFNQKIKELGRDLDFPIDEVFGSSHEMIIEILEPTCNMNFFNTLIGISKEGKIITQQYDYDDYSVMVNDFKDIVSKNDKQKIIDLLN
jgi:hypothetical protein